MTKSQKYKELAAEIFAVVEGEPSRTARYATAACLLSQAFEDFFWTGFYVVDPHNDAELVVGPYQGTLGCLRIAFGKGVCGTCAAQGQTVIVEDVHAFPGHIACDTRTNSEIVVPVFDDAGRLAAVLDVDSVKLGSFDTEDQQGLEMICGSLLKGARLKGTGLKGSGEGA